jgi:hypothetical protein
MASASQGTCKEGLRAVAATASARAMDRRAGPVADCLHANTLLSAHQVYVQQLRRQSKCYKNTLMEAFKTVITEPRRCKCARGGGVLLRVALQDLRRIGGHGCQRAIEASVE